MSPHHRLRFLEERALFDKRRLMYKAKREVKKEFTDFLRFWWVELLVIAVLNVHMGKVVGDVAHKVARVLPW